MEEIFNFGGSGGPTPPCELADLAEANSGKEGCFRPVQTPRYLRFYETRFAMRPGRSEIKPMHPSQPEAFQKPDPHDEQFGRPLVRTRAGRGVRGNNWPHR